LFSLAWKNYLASRLNLLKLAEIIAPTLAAQVFTLPIILVAFNYLPAISILANPPIALLTELMLIGAIPTVITFILWPMLGNIFAGVILFLSRMIVWLTHGLAGLPIALINNYWLAWLICLCFLGLSIRIRVIWKHSL